MKTTLYLCAFILLPFLTSAQAPTEAFVKDKISNLVHHLSKPGDSKVLTFQSVLIGKPVKWTMEFGNHEAADKTTKIYKVIAEFTMARRTYNTASGKEYSNEIKKFRRPYNFYIDKTGSWVCQAAGLSSGMY